jgi:hypothetical protein
VGATVDGLFQGFRGAEGHYPDSTGFLTISSDWQHANEMYFVESGWKVAYTLCPTAVLPKVWAGVRAQHPEIPKPNKVRKTRQVGPGVGPTSAFSSCTPAGMHVPTLSASGPASRLPRTRTERGRGTGRAATRRAWTRPSRLCTG